MTERDLITVEDLERIVAEDAPQPDPIFAAELGERVRAGFPRERRRLRLPTLRRPPVPVLAGAASILLAVAVAVPLLSGDDERKAVDLDSPKSDSAGRALSVPAESAAPSVAAPEPVPPVGDGGFAPGASRRRIERSASLTLTAPGDEIDQVSGRIIAVTDRLGGFVLSSSVSSGEDGEGGQFELRIPARRLQPALAELSKLGHVKARTQQGQDVTRQFMAAEDRLEGARAERRSLLRRLERAGSDAQAEAIRRRLDLNAGEIRGLRAQVRDLRGRTSYASIHVALEKADGEDGASGSGDGGLGAAADDALETLGEVLEALVRVLGVAIPVGLLAALGLASARLVRRRRREAALG